MGSRHFENKARRSWWSVHVAAWRKSGLTRTVYCRQHRLTKDTFDRWLKAIEGAEALLRLDLPKRCSRRQPLSGARRSLAVQAFWAMHVEALNWSNVTAAEYAKAHRIDASCLRLWRRRFDAEPQQVDWRARLHPSARPPLSTRTSDAAKESGDDRDLTATSPPEPATVSRLARRSFSDDQKRAIVLECEQPGASVSAVARAHQLATSALFRWRAELGYGRKEKAKLATVRLRGDSAGNTAVLSDLMPIPDGMAAFDLPDGRRVFAPTGTDPEAVRRHVADRETAP